MTGLAQDARDFNTLAEFLARRDVPQLDAAALQNALGAPRADMVLLFGGSLPEGCRLAGQLWRAGLARKVMTIGGMGHTTAAFLERFKSALPAGHSATEGECMKEYLQSAFGVPEEDLLVESASANCGENVRFALRILQEQNALPASAIVLHDSTMQRRIGATLTAGGLKTQPVSSTLPPIGRGWKRGRGALPLRPTASGASGSRSTT